MGKSKEAYVICKNPRCNAYPGTNKCSWRFVSKGPEACVYCDTPFRVPTAGALKGDDTGGKKGWMQQNSKGRSRPVGQPTQEHQETPKPKEGPRVPREVLEAAMREELIKSDHQDLADSLFPEKPKSRQEMVKEGFSKVDKATAEFDHLTKVCSNMEVKYDKLCEELIDYQGRVQDHQDRLKAAKLALEQANLELIQLRAKESVAEESALPTTPVIAISGVKGVVDSYEPMQSVAQTLGSLPELMSLPADQAARVGQVVSELFKQQLADFYSKLVPLQLHKPAPPPPPSTPAPPHHAAAAETANVGGGPSDDVGMKSEFVGKRSIEEFHANSEDMGGLDHLEEEDKKADDAAPSSQQLRDRAMQFARLATEAKTRAAGAEVQSCS